MTNTPPPNPETNNGDQPRNLFKQLLSTMGTFTRKIGSILTYDPEVAEVEELVSKAMNKQFTVKTFVADYRRMLRERREPVDGRPFLDAWLLENGKTEDRIFEVLFGESGISNLPQKLEYRARVLLLAKCGLGKGVA